MIRFHDDWEDDEDADLPEEDEGDDLDECPRCGRSIYDDSERCPRCGQYLSREEVGPTTSQPLWVRVAAVILLGIMVYELARFF